MSSVFFRKEPRGKKNYSSCSTDKKQRLDCIPIIFLIDHISLNVRHYVTHADLNIWCLGGESKSWVMSQSFGVRGKEEEIVHACEREEAVFDAQRKKRSASRAKMRGIGTRGVWETRWRWTFAGWWWWTYHVPGSPGATARSRSSDSSSSSGTLVGLTVSLTTDGEVGDWRPL